MTDNRVLTFQDISCVGQCSLTAVLPILAACGVETIPLPSAVLSTHTGGFTGNTFRDLTEDLPEIIGHWKREKLLFDCLYTGYLGSIAQIDFAEAVKDAVIRKDGLLIVDPVMADHGKLYRGFDGAFVSQMARLCSHADMILPNMTEAAFLTGSEVLPERQKKADVEALIERLSALCPGTILLKGVSFEEGRIGVGTYDPRKGKTEYCFTEKIDRSYHGTGDCFAAAFVGAIMQGKEVQEAAALAADFVAACIRATVNDPKHWYGVRLERALPLLAAALNA